jgi:hypothetical protein
MSVVVRGMRIPESCTKCKFSYKEESYEPKEGTYYSVSTCKGDVISTNYYTSKTHKEYAYKRPDYCPLVEIPEKHGRMIDFDALIEKYWDGNSMTITAWDLKDIKAVIEAEDE